MTENTSPKTPIDAVTEIMGSDAEYDAAEKAVEARADAKASRAAEFGRDAVTEAPENVVTMAEKAAPRKSTSRANKAATRAAKKTGNPQADRERRAAALRAANAKGQTPTDAATARDASVLDGVKVGDTRATAQGKADPPKAPAPKTAKTPKSAKSGSAPKSSPKSGGKKDLTVYRDKAATTLIQEFNDWLVAEVGITFRSKAEAAAFLNGVRLSGTLRHEFQSQMRAAK